MHDVVPARLVQEVTDLVHERAVALSAALGARLGPPRDPPIARDVEVVVAYVRGSASKLATSRVTDAANRLIDVLSMTCYPPATLAARAIFDRKAGEPNSSIEAVLLAARARLDIELDLHVPIRWLAVLGGVSVKTARNLASSGRLSTHTNSDGQVASAPEAARWLSTRGVLVQVGIRRQLA